MSHILIKNAKRGKFKQVPDIPSDARYNTISGLWEINQAPLVFQADFIKSGVSKKCDQETGEDQKGE